MTTFLEVTQAESDRLDLIIDNWSNPDYVTDPSSNILAQGLLKHLIILKGTIIVASDTPVTEEEFDEDAFELILPDLDDTNIPEDLVGYTPPVFGGSVTSEIVVTDEGNTVSSVNNGYSGATDHDNDSSSELEPSPEHNVGGYEGVV